MSEQNKALDGRLIAEVWNEGRLEVIDEIFAGDYVNRTPPRGLSAGREGVRLTIRGFRTAFPDVRLTIDDVIAVDEKVVTRWTMRATHTGTGFAIPSTGRKVWIMGIWIHRYANGKVVESWTSFDRLGLLEQLGFMPSK